MVGLKDVVSRCACQLLPPVCELLGCDLLYPAALPYRVISVLQRQALARGWQVPGEGLVKGLQFRNKNLVERKAVKDDVVKSEVEAVLVLGEAHQPPPIGRARFQIEGKQGIFEGHLASGLVSGVFRDGGEIDIGYLDVCGRRLNELHEFAVLPAKRRSP